MIHPAYCICVPARDEAPRLPILLDALAAQTIVGLIPVALCINNSVDDSVAIVDAAAARHVGRLDLRVDEQIFAPGVANAGTARGHAMEQGYDRIGGSGVLTPTDADCRPPESWIANTLAAIAAGASVVGGRIELDADESISPEMMKMRARFDHYWSCVRAIEDTIDPSPHDLPPRHGDHTGASLAIDAALYRAVGGVRPIASGEDRALMIAAIAAGGRLAHPPGVWTRASGRREGRANAGMAEAMEELAAQIDQGQEPLVPSFAQWAQRARWRLAERASSGIATMLAREELLPIMTADMLLPRLAR